ncbi:FtsX-like permease family protein [Aquimarina gracilis]|uniref:FtsX-like permease family protein n=1 Tax=Aquimarina gracilis TaxID=874422 RepID=A0ABU5ZUH4_9FLAO|nr:FtsX-like permease family protein [Aquimarina gracilis]MEB3345649.1 FtsX-like permease family protein [Aquimarina gracilis]
MIFNYLKITFSVLKRNRFYSFIVFFGICFTLTIIVLLSSIFSQLFGAGYPEGDINKKLYVLTILEIDKETNLSRTGGFSPYFANNFLKEMKTPDKVSIVSGGNVSNTYLNNKKIKYTYKYTDAEFWDINSFDFIEGRPFGVKDIADNRNLIVISDEFKEEYFGNVEKVVGKKVIINDLSYEVAGVVKESSNLREVVYANVYLPHDLNKNSQSNTDIVGNYRAIFMASDKSSTSLIKKEYSQILKNAAANAGAANKELISHADTFLEVYTRNTFGNIFNDSGTSKFYTILGILILIFLFLPALTLINLILTKMSERADEIAIRKSVGASSLQIFFQFIVENIMINLLGAIFALLLSFVLIKVIDAYFFEKINLTLNWFVLLVTLILSLVFSLISGAYPAYRLSKMEPIGILKSNS